MDVDMDLSFLVIIFIGYGFLLFHKRMKVQDSQFETLIARLNELTNRDFDDLSSKYDEKQ